MKKFSLTSLVALISCTFYCAYNCQAKSVESFSTSRSESENVSDGDAMSRCNETFRIKPGSKIKSETNASNKSVKTSIRIFTRAERYWIVP